MALRGLPALTPQFPARKAILGPMGLPALKAQPVPLALIPLCPAQPVPLALIQLCPALRARKAPLAPLARMVPLALKVRLALPQCRLTLATTPPWVAMA
jgi:hypothetical protein